MSLGTVSMTCGHHIFRSHLSSDIPLQQQHSSAREDPKTQMLLAFLACTHVLMRSYTMALSPPSNVLTHLFCCTSCRRIVARKFELAHHVWAPFSSLLGLCVCVCVCARIIKPVQFVSSLPNDLKYILALCLRLLLCVSVGRDYAVKDKGLWKGPGWVQLRFPIGPNESIDHDIFDWFLCGRTYV